MSAVMKNSAIAAKICCMRSNMLTKDDYLKMTELENVAQVAAYLKSNTVYSYALKNIDETKIHRESLELLLKGTLLDDFERLYCFADNELKVFLSKVLMFYEADAIVKAAQKIYTQSYADEKLSRFLKRHIDVDLDALKKASDLEKFVQALANTQYYRALANVAKNRESLKVSDIETALGIYCYTSIMKYIFLKLDASERESVNMFYGALIDIMNLRSLCRCKCNFNLESEYVFSYIIPYYYRIKKEDILKMANAKTEAELMALISSTKYADIFDGDLIEQNVNRSMYNTAKRLLRLYPYNYVSINSYFRMKETEIRNIFSVIEGIRYSLSSEEIMSYVAV